jgi:hypothetical protein
MFISVNWQSGKLAETRRTINTFSRRSAIYGTPRTASLSTFETDAVLGVLFYEKLTRVRSIDIRGSPGAGGLQFEFRR